MVPKGFMRTPGAFHLGCLILTVTVTVQLLSDEKKREKILRSIGVNDV